MALAAGLHGAVSAAGSGAGGAVLDALGGHFLFAAEGGFFKGQMDMVHLQQSAVLPCQGIVRLREDVYKVFLSQGFQSYMDRKTALKLRNKVFYCGNVESTGCDKQHIVGFYRSVFSNNGTTFYYR